MRGWKNGRVRKWRNELSQQRDLGQAARLANENNIAKSTFEVL